MSSCMDGLSAPCRIISHNYSWVGDHLIFSAELFLGGLDGASEPVEVIQLQRMDTDDAIKCSGVWAIATKVSGKWYINIPVFL